MNQYSAYNEEAEIQTRLDKMSDDIDDLKGQLESVNFDVNTRNIRSLKYGLEGENSRDPGHRHSADSLIYYSTTTVGNVGTGEDDLMSYTVPANLLVKNGDAIEFEATGTFATSVNNKQLRVRFGSGATTLLFDSGAQAITAAADWVLHGTIIRTGAATQVGYAILNTSSATLLAYADVETGLNHVLTGSATLKLTAEATSNNDVTQTSFIVRWVQNNSA